MPLMAVECAFTGLRRGIDALYAYGAAYGKCQGKDLYERAITHDKEQVYLQNLGSRFQDKCLSNVCDFSEKKK